MKLFRKRDSKRKRSEQITQPVFSSELELLTKQVLDEAIGETGAITVEFEKRMSAYDPNVNPISEQEAKALLISMMRLAVAKRKLIVGRIEKSVEVGSLFERYYGKLQKIHELANLANATRLEMLAAEEKYQYANKIYKKVRARAYEEEYIPEEDDSDPSYQKDLFEAIDQVGGRVQ